MRSQSGTRVSQLATAALALLLLSPATAAAYDGYQANVPNGYAVRCVTCHLTSEGGRGCPDRPCFNPFGSAFQAGGKIWTRSLADADSDNDGYSNGVELADPFFTWTTMPMPPAYPPRSPGLDTGTHGSDMNECLIGIDECVALAMCIDEVGAVLERPATYDCSCPSGFTGDGTSSGTGCTEIVLPPPPPDPPPGGGGIPELRAATYAGEGEWLWINTAGEDTAPVETSCGPTGRDQWFYYPYECNGRVAIDTEGFNFSPVVSLYDSGAFNAEGLGSPPAPRERACFAPGMAPTTTDGSTVSALTNGALLIRFSGLYGASGSGRFRVRCDLSYNPGATCTSARPLPEDEPTRYTLQDTRNMSVSGAPPHDPCPLRGDVWFDYVPTCTGQAVVTLSGYEDVTCDSLRTWGVGAYRGDGCENLMDEPSACSGLARVSSAGTACASATRTLAFGVLEGESYRVRVGGSNTHSASVTVTCLPAEVCSGENGVQDNCHAAADCVAGDGAPECECDPGYAGDGLQTDLGGAGCEPAVCANAGNACDDEGTCNMASGTCSCDPGYVDSGTGAPGTTCVDQNECATGSPCAFGSVCQNRIGQAPGRGGYDCVCRPGLSLPEGSTTCRSVCGDGIVTTSGLSNGSGGTWPAEACDDGNTIANDGCSPTCTLEETHVCGTSPPNGRTVCVPGVCGDGVHQPLLGEDCDWADSQMSTCPETCRFVRSGCQASASDSPRQLFLVGWVALALGVLMSRTRRRRVPQHRNH